jgi:hypothetical protein
MADSVIAHRNQVQWASGLNFLAAVWLFLSAFAVATRSPMVTSNVVFGIVVGLLAIIRAGGAYEQSWMSWLNALIGVWVIISPWVLLGTGQSGPTQGTIISNVITGAVIVVLGCWSAIATITEPGGTPPESARPSFGR